MKQGWIQVTNNNTQEPLAPKTMADMVFMDDPQTESVKDAILYHAPIHLVAELPVEGWTTVAPFTQTVPVTGLLATDVPLADVVLSADLAVAIQQLQAYGLVSRMDTADGLLTACCYGARPQVAFAILLKVVR